MSVLFFTNVHSQTKTLRLYFKIEEKHLIKYNKTISAGDTIVIPTGTTTTESTKNYKIGDTEYTTSTENTETAGTTILADKKMVVSAGRLSGKANIQIDKNDPSIVHVNYWLEGNTTVSAGTTLIYQRLDGTTIRQEILTRDTKLRLTPVPIAILNNYMGHVNARQGLVIEIKRLNAIAARTLAEQQELQNSYVLLQTENQALENLKDLKWLENAKYHVIATTSGGATTAYVEKYQNDGDYFFKLENRQYISLRYQSIEIGALTVPFKFRPGYYVSDKNIRVNSQFTADINIGTYIGYTVGKLKYTYTKNVDSAPRKKQFSTGPFFTFSRVEIDSLSTITASKPLRDGIKKGIATFSPGWGFMGSIYDIRVGFFIGTDVAMSSLGRKWIYNNRPWFGFGVGYNLALIWGGGK